MKTIGLIGGTSWVSTIDYYRIINATVNRRLGGNESAKIILHSVNYGEIVTHTRKDEWDAINHIISTAALKAEQAGADCILLCANTMHRIADSVQSAIKIPLIHIATETARTVKDRGLSNILLLGTRYTMNGTFYPAILQQAGLDVIVPNPTEVDWINDSIYNEMGQGSFLDATKQKYISLINEYAQRGAEGVIFGCTEIPMLLKQEDCPVPVFDTTMIHATAAVDFALRD